MRGAAELLTREPRARAFFLAHAQSSLGTGAGYVALLLVAYERLRSPWAIALVLLADFLPAMFLGPLFGAAADRWSRRLCAVAADLARAVAFVALGLVGGIWATVALALLAGAGSGLFTPAVLAGLPGLVTAERRPAATSLFGAVADLGHTFGPAAAAAFLLVAGPESLLVANGLTFALSAAVLARIDFGERAAAPPELGRLRRSLVSQAKEGLAATARMSGVRAVLGASTAAVLFAGMLNVGELLLASEELGASRSEFSVLVAVFGLGVVAGSLGGTRAGALGDLKRRYLAGLLLLGIGLAAAGAAPGLAAALLAFALGGLGNGLVVVHERLILQRAVDDRWLGRVFGVSDALGAWAFAGAFLGAGALLSLIDPRELFLIAGAGALAVWLASTIALRRAWGGEEPRPGAARLQSVAARFGRI